MKKFGLIAGSLGVLVAVVSAAGVGELRMKWAVNASNLFPPFIFGGGHLAAQTVWDIDGDTINEIVFGTRRGDTRRLWCFNAQGEFEWIYPPLDQDGLPGDPTSKVSLVDVDNDGVYEICFAGRGGRLHVLNEDGTVFWIWDSPSIGSDIYGPPQAYDVDGDGYVEFFVRDAWSLYRVNHEGQQLWSVSYGSGGNDAQPTIADIDQDDGYELLFLGKDHYLYCIDAKAGSERWRFDTGMATRFMPVVVADVNRDGDYEAVVCGDETADRPGGVLCISYAGLKMWSWELPQTDQNIPKDIRFLQTFGDVDDDGSLDMVIMSNIGVHCVDIGGVSPEVKWEINLTRWGEEGILPKGLVNTVWSCYQLIADVDGDERQEVLIQSPYPVVVDGTTGEPEAYYLNEYVSLRRGAENGGWWGDVDGDGRSEWVCELEGGMHYETGVYCLTLDGTFPARSPWPEYYHCAYPSTYQTEQDWITLKAAYSNSLWFHVSELPVLLRLPRACLMLLLCLTFGPVKQPYGRCLCLGRVED